MMKRMRILEPEQGAVSFTESLEHRARQITEQDTRDRWEASANSILERQISLSLDHIDGLRQLNERLGRSLLRQECYVDTDMMYLNRPKYPIQPHHERRAKLKDRLRRIERERRELAASHQEKMQGHHDRLLDLLNKHRQLTLENGYR